MNIMPRTFTDMCKSFNKFSSHVGLDASPPSPFLGVEILKSRIIFIEGFCLPHIKNVVALKLQLYDLQI